MLLRCGRPTVSVSRKSAARMSSSKASYRQKLLRARLRIKASDMSVQADAELSVRNAETRQTQARVGMGPHHRAHSWLGILRCDVGGIASVARPRQRRLRTALSGQQLALSGAARWHGRLVWPNPARHLPNARPSERWSRLRDGDRIMFFPFSPDGFGRA
jgi:hypothetical protein